MYKLVTNDSAAYALSMLPYEGKIEKKGMQVKVICIPFGAEIDTLAAVKEICNDSLKTAVMKVSEDSVDVRTYRDYTVLEQITTATINVGDEEQEILLAKLSQSTPIPEQLEMLKEGVELLQKENNDLKETVNGFSDLKTDIETVSEEVEAIGRKIAYVDVSTLGLEDLKEYMIRQSKINLANYLETHTVTSTAHKGVSAEYSMTSDKQTQLMAMIMLCQMNPEYTPSWNARGEVCSYDWTVEELQGVAADIEAVVRPLIAKQQKMEVDIRKATSVDEVNAVSILF